MVLNRLLGGMILQVANIWVSQPHRPLPFHHQQSALQEFDDLFRSVRLVQAALEKAHGAEVGPKTSFWKLWDFVGDTWEFSGLDAL